VLVPRLTDQALVELLKQPTCVGLGQKQVLAELGRRLGPPAAKGEAGAGTRRAFLDVWETVTWLRENHPHLDLSSPLNTASR